MSGLWLSGVVSSRTFCRGLVLLWGVLGKLLPLEETGRWGRLWETLPKVPPGKCGILFPVFCFAFLVVFRMLIVFAAFVARDAAGLVPVVVAPAAVHLVWVAAGFEVGR